jgi:hypothetical protein
MIEATVGSDELRALSDSAGSKGDGPQRFNGVGMDSEKKSEQPTANNCFYAGPAFLRDWHF